MRLAGKRAFVTAAGGSLRGILRAADDDALDDQCLFLEIDFDGFELVVFGQQRYQ